jgi:hypothetical protein
VVYGMNVSGTRSQAFIALGSFGRPFQCGDVVVTSCSEVGVYR